MTHTFCQKAALAAVTLLAGAGWADTPKFSAAPTADVIKQDAAAALQADIALVAAGRSVSAERVAKAIAFQERFTEYAQRLDARFPNQISRIWLEPAPATQGYIGFTGDVPAYKAMKDVELFGDGVLTRAEHAARAEVAADALKAAGYRNFLTHFDAERGAIRVELRVGEKAWAPSEKEVLSLVSDEITHAERKSRPALRFAAPEVDLRIIRAEGPIYTPEWSRGGLWCRDDGFEECTSGWAVSGPNGNGIITAAHCTGLNSIGGADHAMTFRSQERDKGDVEYHTTAGVEVAEFWANSSTIRDVESTKETLWMLPGNSVCVYGRSSDVRDCTHDIEATGVTVTGDDGVTVRKMVRASGDSTIGGDSGGGWSWSTKAWGVHSGSNDVDSFFTPVGRAERELNVDVLTK
jgi:hypothetical protein